MAGSSSTSSSPKSRSGQRFLRFPGKRRQHIAQNPRHKPHRLCSSRSLCSLRSPAHTAHTVCAARASSVCLTTHASCADRTSRSADAAHRSGHDATVLAAIPSCGCRTSTTAGGSHAASSIRNTNRRCARPAAIRLGSDDAKLPPGGTDSAGDASSTSRTSGTGDIACFGSFKRRDTGVPTQSGRAACGRCRGNTSVPA